MISSEMDDEIRSRFRWLAGLFALAFLAFGYLATQTLHRATVTGPLIQELGQARALATDVTPPPLSLGEAYLLVIQMAGETDAARLDTLVAQSRAARDAYYARRLVWIRELPDSAMKEALVLTAARPAHEFFELRDRVFIPAVLRGDGATAHGMAAGVLKQKYESHGAALAEVVKQATGRQTTAERQAAEGIQRETGTLLWVGGALLAVVAGFPWLMGRDLVRRLAQAVAPEPACPEAERVVVPLRGKTKVAVPRPAPALLCGYPAATGTDNA